MTSAPNTNSPRIIDRDAPRRISEAWNGGISKGGPEWYYFRCPLHEDKTASGSGKWLPGDDGNGDVRLLCKAKCSSFDLKKKAEEDCLIPPWVPTKKRSTKGAMEVWTNKGLIHLCSYPYTDEENNLLFEKCRFKDPETGEKTFRQRESDGAGGFIQWKVISVRKVLYRLPRLIEGIQAGQAIYIMEGEKDVELATSDGFYATTNFEGAGKWNDDYTKTLKDANRIVQVIDNDWAGYEHLNLVGSSLAKEGIELSWVVMPDVKEHGDYSDFREAGGSVERFDAIVDEAPIWTEKIPNPYPSPEEVRKAKKAKEKTEDQVAPFGCDENNVVQLYTQEAINIDYIELWTDSGTAGRFVKRYDRQVLHAKERGFFLWNGKKYTYDNKDFVKEMAKDVARSISEETNLAPPDKLKKFATKTLNESGLHSMLGSVKSMIAIELDDFNRDPSILNTQDGVVNLRTGAIEKHDKKFMCSQITACGYDPDAFNVFANDVVDDYYDLIPAYMEMMTWVCGDMETGYLDIPKLHYLQEVGGYCTSGFTHIQQAWFFEGGGRNLKSTFIDNLYFMLGEEKHGYSVTGRPEMFMRRKNGGENHIDNFSQLQDKRMCAVQELNSDDSLDEAKFKTVTGHTDILKGRYMRGEPFDIRNRAKFIFRTQFLPRIRNQDDGVWRRVRRVPFHNQIPEDQVKDGDEVDKTLRKEWSQLCAFFVRGLVRLLKRGSLPQPSCVEEMTKEYKEEMDVVGDMLDECFIKSSDNELTIMEFLRVHEVFCKKSNQSPYGKIELGRRLAAKGLKRGRARDDGTQVRTYAGYEVKPEYLSGSRYQ